MLLLINKGVFYINIFACTSQTRSRSLNEVPIHYIEYFLKEIKNQCACSLYYKKSITCLGIVSFQKQVEQTTEIVVFQKVFLVSSVVLTEDTTKSSVVTKIK